MGGASGLKPPYAGAFDASDPRVSSLKEAMLSTDIIFTNTCCDAKK